MASDFVAIGRKVKVLSTEKELKGTTFKPGWYEGEIQWHDKDMDTVGIAYHEDLKRGAMAVYELCLILNCVLLGTYFEGFREGNVLGKCKKSLNCRQNKQVSFFLRSR